MSFIFFLLFTLSDTGQVLRVGTFNCEFMNREKVHMKYGYGFNLDGEDLALWNKPGLRDKKFKQALKPVAKVIVKMNVDVIVLSEVGDKRDVNALRLEVKKLGRDYPYFQVSDSKSVTFQHVAVLSRYPLDLISAKIPGWAFYDPEPDDPSEEKEVDVQKALHVSFMFKGQKINLIGAHLPSERRGHDQDTMRVAVASLIRRYSLPMIQNGEHLIIAGDLNDRRGEPALRMIRGREDVYGDLIQTGQTAFFHPKQYKERWTYMYKGDRTQLDYILPTRSLKSLCLDEYGIQCQVIAVDYLKRASMQHPRTSDHRAFVTEFKFK